MERGLLSSKEFAAFGKKLVPFVHVSSNVKGEKHPNLSLVVGPGWPQAAILNSEGQLLARLDTRALAVDGVEGIQEVIDGEVAEFFALEKKAKGGDKEAVAEFFMKRLELDHAELPEMKKMLKEGSPLDSYQRGEVKEKVIGLMTVENLRGLRGDRPKSFGLFAKKLLAQHKSIGLPEGPEGFTAWSVILEDAYLRKDPKTFSLAFRALRATGIVGKKFVTANEKRLKTIRGGKE